MASLSSRPHELDGIDAECFSQLQEAAQAKMQLEQQKAAHEQHLAELEFQMEQARAEREAELEEFKIRRQMELEEFKGKNLGASAPRCRDEP